ncbi:type I glyceraldehyde-3-phosphate dehydrogenase [Pelagibacterales bacterium SAG-MED15]|nr:type I glyceraldehyde-3-phosphate dehydrogenase [Pelagibacterales bacterium SAG-MED15]
MTVKIGINGLGRIGRMVVRAIIENKYKNIEIKHINNRSSSEVSASLLKYDSVHGQFKSKVNFDKNNIILNGKKITFTQETDIKKINWKKSNIDVVLECTGKFNSKDKLLPHLRNGAKKVIVSAPCKNSDKTIVYGVNENTITKKDRIISAASCTTNCLAPVVKTLNDKFEIEKGFMTTIHAFTSDQRILDNSHKDPRRARSASQSIVPTSTGASKAIGEIIPSLKGKLGGVAMRVPTPNVSLIELIFCTNKDLTINKINNVFRLESKRNLKGILEITDEKLVSVDFNHSPFSSIVDASLTNVIGKKMGKISSWYDNEWGFSCRMCDLVEYLSKKT